MAGQTARKRPSANGAALVQNKRRRGVATENQSDHKLIDEDQYGSGRELDDLPEANSQKEIRQKIVHIASDLRTRLDSTMAELGKEDHWPTEFVGKVTEDEKRLRVNLTNGIKERKGKCIDFTHGFCQILHRAILKPVLNSASERRPWTECLTSKEHPLYLQCNASIQSSKVLLDDYRTIVERSSKPAEIGDLSSKFEMKRDKVVRVIKGGKRVTRHQAIGLLEHRRDPTSRDPYELGGVAEEDAADVRAMLIAGQKKVEASGNHVGNTWGSVAYDAMKAFKSMSRVAERK